MVRVAMVVHKSVMNSDVNGGGDAAWCCHPTTFTIRLMSVVAVHVPSLQYQWSAVCEGQRCFRSLPG